MHAKGMHYGCMTTLTLKNFPEDVLQRLKNDAKRNRRSLTQEAIAQLSERPEGARDTEQMIADLRQFRSQFEGRIWATDEEIDALIAEGRRH